MLILTWEILTYQDYMIYNSCKQTQHQNINCQVLLNEFSLVTLTVLRPVCLHIDVNALLF